MATQTTPIAVNSACNFTTSTIDITAAILRPRFHKPQADVAVNHCAIASARAVAPLLHLDAFHQAVGTRPGDGKWHDPAQRVCIG